MKGEFNVVSLILPRFTIACFASSYHSAKRCWTPSLFKTARLLSTQYFPRFATRIFSLKYSISLFFRTISTGKTVAFVSEIHLDKSLHKLVYLVSIYDIILF